MGDCIDRDKVLAEIEQLKKSPWYTAEEGHFYRREAIDILRVLCIINAQAADVIKKPSCNSCRHYREEPSETMPGQVVVWCAAEHYPHDKAIPDGWYCAGWKEKID